MEVIKVFAFFFGAIIGSMLNMLIYRLPREISPVLPRSFCPNCNKKISWYENIPIFSYLFLKGRCSGCGTKISICYPLVELSSGLVALLLVPWPFTTIAIWNFLFLFAIFSVFLTHFLIDLRHKILPDSLNIFLAVIFLVYSIINNPWQFWVVGGLIGFLFPLVVTWLFYLLRGQIGLGGGDIKLFAALGILFGPIGILHNIFLSCFLGAIVGVVLIVTKKMSKEDPIPFGPYIILVATIQIFFPELLRWLY